MLCFFLCKPMCTKQLYWFLNMRYIPFPVAVILIVGLKAELYQTWKKRSPTLTDQPTRFKMHPTQVCVAGRGGLRDGGVLSAVVSEHSCDTDSACGSAAEAQGWSTPAENYSKRWHCLLSWKELKKQQKHWSLIFWCIGRNFHCHTFCFVFKLAPVTVKLPWNVFFFNWGNSV